MEHPLCAKDWAKYFTYFMSHLYLIPAGIGMIIPVLQIRKQRLGRSYYLLKVTQLYLNLVTCDCKAPALSRVLFASSAFAKPSAFRILKLSGQGVNFQKKGPCFKSSITWL